MMCDINSTELNDAEKLRIISCRWGDILAYMRNTFSVPQIAYITWLLPLKPCSVVGTEINIDAGTDEEVFFRIVSSRYGKQLAVAIQDVTGINISSVVLVGKRQKNQN